MEATQREADAATGPSIYGRYAAWYPLWDPVEAHAEEVEVIWGALSSAISSPAQTLLELGSGAGNNAFYMKQRVRCTLSDIAAPMLALSRAQNPECAHVLGDMRTLRLGQTFDLVLAHDGITYMTTPDELRAAAETVFVHTRPGGAALVTPDVFAEDFEEETGTYARSDGARALRCLEWAWDPDPSDTSCVVECAFLLREGGRVEHVYDRHVEGLFTRMVWRDTLRAVGFDTVRVVARPIGDGEHDEVFVCTRGV